VFDVLTQTVIRQELVHPKMTWRNYTK